MRVRFPPAPLYKLHFSLQLNSIELMNELPGVDPGNESEPNKQQPKDKNQIIWFKTVNLVDQAEAAAAAGKNIDWESVIAGFDARDELFDYHDEMAIEFTPEELIGYAIAVITERIYELEQKFELLKNTYSMLDNYVNFLHELAVHFKAKIDPREYQKLQTALERSKEMARQIGADFARYDAAGENLRLTGSLGMGAFYTKGERLSMYGDNEEQTKAEDRAARRTRWLQIKTNITIEQLLVQLDEVKGYLIPDSFVPLDPRTHQPVFGNEKWQPTPPEDQIHAILVAYLDFMGTPDRFDDIERVELDIIHDVLLAHFPDNVLQIIAEVTDSYQLNRVSRELYNLLLLVTELVEKMKKTSPEQSINQAIGLVEFMNLPVVLESGGLTLEYWLKTTASLDTLLTLLPDKELVTMVEVPIERSKSWLKKIFTGNKMEQKIVITESTSYLLRLLDEVETDYRGTLETLNSNSDDLIYSYYEDAFEGFKKVKTELEQRLANLTGSEISR